MGTKRAVLSNVLLLKHEKTGYVDVSLGLCHSNTSNACIALKNFLDYPN